MLFLVVALATFWPGHAFAGAPSISVPSGPLSDGQVITVTGTGFPSHAQDPSGIQIIECSDPQGSAANLPTDATTCDGATANPLPVAPDSSGRFTDRYTISALNGQHGASNIDCDASDFCVLWAGQDYNQAFTSGPHAFSTPFEVQGGATGGGTGAPSPSTTVTTTPASASAGGNSPATTVAAGPGAPTAASLASTGPAQLPWLLGSGLVLVLVGSAGRRLIGRRSA